MAMVLARVDRGLDQIDAPAHYGPRDLIPVSPVTEAHLPAGFADVGTLVEAVLERSDNTAANLPLHHVGGPSALTAWLRATGDAATVIGRHEIVPGQTGPENTSTPASDRVARHPR